MQEFYYMSSSKQNQEEILLRENIRYAIKIVLDKRGAINERSCLEEKTLRSVVRGLIIEAKQEVPLGSTAMNKLRGVLNNIIPNIKRDYQSLTTSEEQRESFKIVLMAAIENLLQTAEMNLSAGGAVEELVEVLNEIDVEVGQEDKDKIIPLDSDEVEEEEEFTKEIGLEGEELDKTGRDDAVQTFHDAVENQVKQAFTRLGDEGDRDEFAEYLVKNVLQHLENAEEEIATTVGQIETDIEQDDVAQAAVGGEEVPEEEAPEEEEEKLEEFIDLDELLSNL